MRIGKQVTVTPAQLKTLVAYKDECESYRAAVVALAEALEHVQGEGCPTIRTMEIAQRALNTHAPTIAAARERKG